MVTNSWLTEDVSVRVFRCTVSNELFPGSLILGIYHGAFGQTAQILNHLAISTYWTAVNEWHLFPTWNAELNWILFRLSCRCDRTCKREAFVLYKRSSTVVCKGWNQTHVHTQTTVTHLKTRDGFRMHSLWFLFRFFRKSSVRNYKMHW